MSAIEEKILAFLNAAGVGYEVREHPPVYTCPKMAEYLGADENLIAKSMMLRKNSGEYFLVVLPGKMKIDFESLAKVVKCLSVSLAPMDEAEKIAGCPVGCVHPFGNLMNVDTYFDEKMLQNEYVYFNSGSHTKSVRIKTRELTRLIEPTVAGFSKSSGTN